MIPPPAPHGGSLVSSPLPITIVAAVAKRWTDTLDCVLAIRILVGFAATPLAWLARVVG